ncbi:unnamed protein product [Prorocentrum cordatum]|uniref:Uncharacterized protein n=1 Tax=Prorocentrum cordatum TaxID=2364126 RepID=A0ABN9YDY1_9DINO|nr:unnamed protein product [Polarella glacialis]
MPDLPPPGGDVTPLVDLLVQEIQRQQGWAAAGAAQQAAAAAAERSAAAGMEQELQQLAAREARLRQESEAAREAEHQRVQAFLAEASRALAAGRGRDEKQLLDSEARARLSEECWLREAEVHRLSRLTQDLEAGAESSERRLQQHALAAEQERAGARARERELLDQVGSLEADARAAHLAGAREWGEEAERRLRQGALECDRERTVAQARERELLDQVGALEARASAFSVQLEGVRGERDELVREVARLRAELDEVAPGGARPLRAQVESLRAELSTVQAARVLEQQRFQEFLGEARPLDSEVRARLLEECRRSEAENRRLSQLVQDLEADAESSERRLQQHAVAAEQERAGARARERELLDQVGSLQASACSASLAGSREENEHRHLEMRLQRGALSASRERAGAQAREKELLDQVGALEARASACSVQLEGARRERDELVRERAELLRDRTELLAETQRLRSENEALSREAESFGTRHADYCHLQGEVAALRGAQADCDELRQEAARLRELSLQRQLAEASAGHAAPAAATAPSARRNGWPPPAARGAEALAEADWGAPGARPTWRPCRAEVDLVALGEAAPPAAERQPELPRPARASDRQIGVLPAGAAWAPACRGGAAAAEELRRRRLAPAAAETPGPRKISVDLLGARGGGPETWPPVARVP